MYTIFYDPCKNNAFIYYKYILVNTVVVLSIILYIFLWGEKRSSKCVNVRQILMRHFNRNYQCTILPIVEILTK